MRRISFSLALGGTLLAAGATLLGARATRGEARLSSARSYSIEVSAGDLSYLVDKDGDVDLARGATRLHDDWHLAALTDVSLEIENLGDQPVRDPRVIVDGQRDWWSSEGILRQALAGASAPMERALAVWDFARRNRYHDNPVFEGRGGEELHDPVKLFTIYGSGLCDDVGRAGATLYRSAGLDRARAGGDPYVRHLHGHMMTEVMVDGAYRFLDADRDVFYLDRDGRGPIGGDQVALDHDLAKREAHFGPGAQPWRRAEEATSLFGADDSRAGGAGASAGLHFELRPGESVTYLFRRDGPFPAHNEAVQRKISASALFVYDSARRPPQELAAVGDQLSLPFELPFPLAAAQLDARFQVERGGAAEVAFSLDGARWTPLCRVDLEGEQRCASVFTEQLEVKAPPARYGYQLRVTLRQARLRALRVESTTLVSLLALPHLALGRNEVRYTDATRGPRRVRITHRWREARATTVAAPQPLAPADLAVVATDTVELRWSEQVGADLYHLYLGRGDNLRFPFRPSFDTYVDATALRQPAWGLFRPDEPYTWIVRARSGDGVWGPWSAPRSFRWRGPMAPRDLALEQRGDELVLTWAPSPEGEPAVAYEVFASDERAFTPSLQPREVLARGQVEGDLVARVEARELVAVTPRPQHPGQNRSCWRVVAVDADGVRSAPSMYKLIPRPRVVAPARVEGVAGSALRIPLWVLRSLGDLQYRPVPDRPFRLWAAEQPEVEVRGAPDWLERDATGLVGRAAMRGAWNIRITARLGEASAAADVHLVVR